jgi:uncharacterized protein (UPF0332 family)
MPPDETALSLMSFRLQQARNSLESALDTKDFQTAANRSYYSIFYAMRALQALDRFDSKKHSGVIAHFRQNYIKTGIFPVSFSDIVGNAFKVRIESDYEDFYLVSKAEVAAQVENAGIFLEAVEKYVNERAQSA